MGRWEEEGAEEGEKEERREATGMDMSRMSPKGRGYKEVQIIRVDPPPLLNPPICTCVVDSGAEDIFCYVCTYWLGCICAYVLPCVCMHVCISACVNFEMCLFVCKRVHAFMPACMFVCLCVACMHVCACVWERACCVCVCGSVHVCVCLQAQEPEEAEEGWK